MPIHNNYVQSDYSSREPQQFGDNQHFTATAHRYICNNLSNLADSVEPNKQDFKFLQVFLNSPALKELIDVRKKYLC